ncbi:hypothetical protein SUNI508_03913 [Seiridium unicorne]|uniref:Uncharacterized protein n=1 Tax=Seiridium unicorne TaxID=138068 RepID=A0ABR2VAJ7_9PEZI
MFLKAVFTTLAAVGRIQTVRAAPTVSEDLTISVSAAHIVKNDFTSYEGHPALSVFTRWLHTSSESLMLRDNATSVERFPTFHSIECKAGTEACVLMAAAKEREIAGRERELSPRVWGWTVEHLVAEVHYKTYHTLTNDEDEEFYAGFEHYITFDWNCQSVPFKSTGSKELMADHGFKVFGSPRVHEAFVTTTVMHNGPLHNEDLVITFSCGIWNDRCCLSGGYEKLTVDGKDGHWAREPERTCNIGKQSSDKCS